MDYWAARATGHFRVTDLDKPSETRSGTARARNESRWWAVGWSAAWPPPWPGDVPPLGIPRIRSDVVVRDSRGIVLHRDTYASSTTRIVLVHRCTLECMYVHTCMCPISIRRHWIHACARRSNNYGHRDIGLRRTYDEGTRNAYERA